MTEVILDCNVAYSGLRGRDSFPAKVVDSVLEGKHLPLFSDDLLGEYRRVLSRPRALAWHGRSAAAVEAFIRSIQVLGRVVSVSPALDCPDPLDQHLWDLLATVPEAILVTGERDLLRSDHFPGRVLSPREFVERYIESS